MSALAEPAADNPVRRLAPAERNLDPYLHIDPCYLNVATCTKLFGYYFKDFYLSRTVKENTDYARIFNDHLLVTFAMDALRDREAASLGEVLANPSPGDLFCSTELLEGTEGVFGEARARNRVVLPYAAARDVFIEFDPHHFLSQTEREAHAGRVRTSLMCHVDIVKDDLISATALVMGTPTFTHFRNHGATLDFADHAADWFETWPEDIDELAACAEIAPPAAAEWRRALENISCEAVCRALAEILDGTRLPGQADAGSRMIACGAHRAGAEAPTAVAVAADGGAGQLGPAVLAALGATPAELWIVQHCHTIGPAVREMVRAFAVRPHAPRRFCLIDGADTWRILTAYGKI